MIDLHCENCGEYAGPGVHCVGIHEGDTKGRLLLVVDGSGCYFENLIWLPYKLDLAVELKAWKEAHPYTLKGPADHPRGRGDSFVKWLKEKGATSAEYEVYDTWNECL